MGRIFGNLSIGLQNALNISITSNEERLQLLEKKTVGYYSGKHTAFLNYFLPKSDVYELGQVGVIGDIARDYFPQIAKLVADERVKVESLVSKRLPSQIIFVGTGSDMQTKYRSIGAGSTDQYSLSGFNMCFLNGNQLMRWGLKSGPALRAVIHEPRHSMWLMSLGYDLDRDQKIYEALGGPEFKNWSDVPNENVNMIPLQEGEEFWRWYGKENAKFEDKQFFESPVAKAFYKFVEDTGLVNSFYSQNPPTSHPQKPSSHS